MATDITALLVAVEEARGRIHPEIPATVLSEILKIEAENPDNRPRARTDIQALIHRAISEGGV